MAARLIYPPVKLGDPFGRWTVLSEAPREKNARMWFCACQCGTFRAVKDYSLKAGESESCGCVHQTHGESTKERKTRLYRAWQAIKKRTTDPHSDHYKYYGARGIRLCPAWDASYENFRDDILREIGPWPGADYTIDRIDNEKGYQPGNVRWSTGLEQILNRRNTRWLTWNGITKTIAQWAKDLGFNKSTLYLRIDKYGWSIAEALGTPATQRPLRMITYNNQTKSLSQWARELGVCRRTLNRRITDGWSPNQAFTIPIQSQFRNHP